MSKNRAPVPVPTTEADITSEWFRSVLEAGGFDPIGMRAALVEPLEQFGFMCDLFRVTPTWNDVPPAGLPASFVVKIPPLDEGGRHVGSMLDAWARECAFYREVAPRSREVRLPTCFHIGEDRSAQSWVIVLEELATDGVTDSQGITHARATSALTELATLHAKWWGSSTRFEWMPGFDAGGVGRLQPLWLQAIPTFVERFGHLIPPDTADWLTTFAPQLSDWSDRVAHQPLTIVHADYRADNLIFDGDNVTMIDWQTALRGPAAMDVASFLATSIDTELRRNVEADLIASYQARLGQAGITVDPQEFETSLDENLLWWMGQFANNLAHLHPPADAQARLDLMVTRTYQMAADRNVGRLLV